MSYLNYIPDDLKYEIGKYLSYSDLDKLRLGTLLNKEQYKIKLTDSYLYNKIINIIYKYNIKIDNNILPELINEYKLDQLNDNTKIESIILKLLDMFENVPRFINFILKSIDQREILIGIVKSISFIDAMTKYKNNLITLDQLTLIFDIVKLEELCILLIAYKSEIFTLEDLIKVFDRMNISNLKIYNCSVKRILNVNFLEAKNVDPNYCLTDKYTKNVDGNFDKISCFSSYIKKSSLKIYDKVITSKQYYGFDYIYYFINDDINKYEIMKYFYDHIYTLSINSYIRQHFTNIITEYNELFHTFQNSKSRYKYDDPWSDSMLYINTNKFMKDTHQDKIFNMLYNDGFLLAKYDYEDIFVKILADSKKWRLYLLRSIIINRDIELFDWTRTNKYKYEFLIDQRDDIEILELSKDYYSAIFLKLYKEWDIL